MKWQNLNQIHDLFRTSHFVYDEEFGERIIRFPELTHRNQPVWVKNSQKYRDVFSGSIYCFYHIPYSTCVFGMPRTSDFSVFDVNLDIPIPEEYWGFLNLNGKHDSVRGYRVLSLEEAMPDFTPPIQEFFFYNLDLFLDEI